MTSSAWQSARLHVLLLLALALPACSILGSKTPSTTYAPEPTVAIDPSWPNADWQLAIGRPEAARMLDSLRIVVRPNPGELEVYKGASWAKTPGEQIQDTLLRALEDSQKIKAVARQGSGISDDYILLTELRRYEADYAGAAVPSATIEVNVKLLHAIDQDIVAARTFQQAVPAAGTNPAAVAQAFGAALSAIGHDIVGWTLVTGHQHQAQHATAPHPTARSGGKSG
jgi:cholesterol transport system auxiliary component